MRERGERERGGREREGYVEERESEIMMFDFCGHFLVNIFH